MKILKALLWVAVGVEIVGACVLDQAITNVSKDCTEEKLREAVNNYHKNNQ